MHRGRTILFIAMLAQVTVVGGTLVEASFDLRVTEVDPFGTDPATATTPIDVEWFEVSNVGSSAWTESAGILYYDDRPANFMNADPMMGVSQISPGESVVFVNLDGVITIADAISAFQTEYPSYLGPVGYYDGSGMSSTGADGASLWVGLPTSNDDVVSFLEYAAGTQVAGETMNAAGVWGAATPGIVPEPSSMIGLWLSFGVALRIRRRRISSLKP